jgi:hypothetical protein
MSHDAVNILYISAVEVRGHVVSFTVELINVILLKLFVANDEYNSNND